MQFCQFFGCGGKKFSKWEHISTKKSYWVTLLWSDSQCVCFIRPNTLLLCIFLFCIFLLYRPDSQVEVQIRILLKNKYKKMQTPAITLWFPEQCLLGYFILAKQLASQNVFLIRSKFSITAYLFLVFYRSTCLQSLSFLNNIKYSFKARWKKNYQSFWLTLFYSISLS